MHTHCTTHTQCDTHAHTYTLDGGWAPQITHTHTHTHHTHTHSVTRTHRMDTTDTHIHTQCRTLAHTHIHTLRYTHTHWHGVCRRHVFVQAATQRLTLDARLKRRCIKSLLSAEGVVSVSYARKNANPRVQEIVRNSWRNTKTKTRSSNTRLHKPFIPRPHRVRQRIRTPRSQRTTLGFSHAKGCDNEVCVDVSTLMYLLTVQHHDHRSQMGSNPK